MDNVYLVAAAWVGLALLASLISIRLGISVALVEIALGIVGGNFLGLGTTSWIDFLALFGSVLLTFLAGAEIDPGSLRRHLGKALAIGSASFALPAAAAFLFAYFVAGWDLHAAEIAGIALSTTSVAVVYAVMIESGLATQEIGKLILAACFVTDLGTVLALGVLFATPGPSLLLFAAVTAAALLILPRVLAWLVKAVPDRVSGARDQVRAARPARARRPGDGGEQRGGAAGLSHRAGLRGGLRAQPGAGEPNAAIAFSLLTPFYFIKAGLLVSLPAIAAGAGLIALLLLVKVGAKTIGVWPVSRLAGLAMREANYTTLLMSTGLTFGTISALFGLRNGLIDTSQYTILVTTVILSAVVPTLIATTFFEPHIRGTGELDEVEAAEEIDEPKVGPR